MDIEKLIEQLHIAGAGNPENIFDVAATALSALWLKTPSCGLSWSIRKN